MARSSILQDNPGLVVWKHEEFSLLQCTLIPVVLKADHYSHLEDLEKQPATVLYPLHSEEFMFKEISSPSCSTLDHSNFGIQQTISQWQMAHSSLQIHLIAFPSRSLNYSSLPLITSWIGRLIPNCCFHNQVFLTMLSHAFLTHAFP